MAWLKDEQERSKRGKLAVLEESLRGDSDGERTFFSSQRVLMGVKSRLGSSGRPWMINEESSKRTRLRCKSVSQQRERRRKL